ASDRVGVAPRGRRQPDGFRRIAVPGGWVMARAFRPPPFPMLRASMLAALALVGALCAASRPAAAQQDFMTFRQQIRPTVAQGGSLLSKRSPAGGDAQMLVKADEIDYDYANDRTAAVGNVQIYYNGATIEADRVVYDQKTKRLRAEGNARLTEADGRITLGEVIDLTDDYRNGFVDSLRVETVDDTRMAATSAERSGGTKPG